MEKVIILNEREIQLIKQAISGVNSIAPELRPKFEELTEYLRLYKKICEQELNKF